MEVKDVSGKTAPRFAEMIELRLQDGGNRGRRELA